MNPSDRALLVWLVSDLELLSLSPTSPFRPAKTGMLIYPERDLVSNEVCSLDNDSLFSVKIEVSKF